MYPSSNLYDPLSGFDEGTEGEGPSSLVPAARHAAADPGLEAPPPPLASPSRRPPAAQQPSSPRVELPRAATPSSTVNGGGTGGGATSGGTSGGTSGETVGATGGAASGVAGGVAGGGATLNGNAPTLKSLVEHFSPPSVDAKWLLLKVISGEVGVVDKRVRRLHEELKAGLVV